MSNNNETYVPQVGDIISVPFAVIRVDGETIIGTRGGGTIEELNPVHGGGSYSAHGPITLISRPKPPAYFEGAEVGQEVWHLTRGDAVINTVSPDWRLPLDVQYKDNGGMMRYGNDGKSCADRVQTLFYANDPRVAQLKAILEAPCASSS